MAEKYGVNQWYLWNIINNDNFVPSNKIAVKLGMVPRKVEILPCPTHGVVHCYDCGTEQVASIDARVIEKKPRRKRNRRAINLDNPASAARTIRNLGGEKFASELVKALLNEGLEMEY